MAKETWKVIPDFPAYRVSNTGRVKSVDRFYIHSYGFRQFLEGKLLTLETTENGYQRVWLCHHGKRTHKRIHRLVASAFLDKPPKEKKEINHKDGNKLNNHASNLEWVTRSENINHAIRVTKTILVGKNHPKSKPVYQYTTDDKFVKEWGSLGDVCRTLGFKKKSIQRCCVGRQKTHRKFKWLRERL